MKRRIKRYVALCISLVLMLEIVPCQNYVQEVKAETLPFTIEDTMDGVVDSDVIAQKLKITDENTEEIVLGIPDLILLKQVLENGKIKMFLVGVKGVIHTYTIEENNSWLDNCVVGKKGEILERLTEKNGSRYYRYAIFKIKNPNTGKWDLMNLTTNEYEELEADDISMQVDRNSYDFGFYTKENKRGLLNEKGMKLSDAIYVGLSCDEHLREQIVLAYKNEEDYQPYDVYNEDGKLIDREFRKHNDTEYNKIYHVNYRFVLNVDDSFGVLNLVNGEVTDIGKTDGRCKVSYLSKDCFTIEVQDGGDKTYLVNQGEVIDLKKYFGGETLQIENYGTGSMHVESYTTTTIKPLQEYEIKYFYDGIMDQNGKGYNLGSYSYISSSKSSRPYDEYVWWQGDYGITAKESDITDKFIFTLRNRQGEELYTFSSDEPTVMPLPSMQPFLENIVCLMNRYIIWEIKSRQGEYNKYIYDTKQNIVKIYKDDLGAEGLGSMATPVCFFDGVWQDDLMIQEKSFISGKNYCLNEKLYFVLGSENGYTLNCFEDETSIEIGKDIDDMTIASFSDGTVLFATYEWASNCTDMIINQNLERLPCEGELSRYGFILNEENKKVYDQMGMEITNSAYDGYLWDDGVVGFGHFFWELRDGKTPYINYKDYYFSYGCNPCVIYSNGRGKLIGNGKYKEGSIFHQGLAYVVWEAKGDNVYEVIGSSGEALVRLKDEYYSEYDNRFEYYVENWGLYHSHDVMEGEGLILSKNETFYLYDFSNITGTEEPDINAIHERDEKLTTDRLLANAESIPDFKFQGMDVSFTVPEEVPVLGGGEMSLDFGKVPIVFEKSENQFRLGLGIENKKSGDDEESLLFYDPDTWGSFKKAVEKQKSNLLKGTNILLASKFGVASTPFNKSVETKIYGYIEGTLDDGKIVSEKGKMVMEISFSAEKKWQTMIVVVPVVFTAKAEAGGKFTMELGLDYEKSSVCCRGEFEFTLPKIRLSAGVGVAYVADISAYGSFTNTLKISDGWDEKASVTDIVSGELGASASLFCLTYEKALWEGEKEIYPGSKKKLKSSGKSFTGEMRESDFVIDRDYAEKTSEWMNKEEDSGQVNQIQVLQKSVYTQANPKIVTLNNGTKLMIFVTDLKERDIGNHTAVAYSVYDGSKNVWLEPEIVDDDGSADFYPEIATDGTHTFITWVNARKTDFTKDTTVNEMAKECDISVAQFDLASKKFVDITSLTDNNYADLRPSIVVKDGMACVTWLTNKNSDCLGLSGKNEICYALNENGSWGTAQSYLVTQKPIKDVKAGELDTEVKIAYTMDEDANFNTTEDVRLCIGDLTGENTTTFDDRKKLSSLQFTKLGSKNILAFSDETGLCYMEDLEKCHKLLNEEVQNGANYQFVSGNNSDMIICSEPSEQGSNIKGYVVNDGVVGLAIPLTNQEKYIRNPNGFYENGKYYLTFTREQVGIAGDSLDVSADICAMQFGEYTDLTVTAVDVDEDTVAPGKKGTVSVNVGNLGTESVSECNIEIKNGEEIVGTANVKNLKPGVEMAEVVSVELPEDYTEGTKLTCKATAEGEEYLKNNSLEFEAGKTNLKLDVFTPETVTYANAYVTNTSGFDTTGVLNVYDTDEKGEILRKIELGKIKAGERKRIKLASIDLEDITASGESLCFKVESDKEESYYSDNVSFVFVAKKNSSEDNDSEENEREDKPEEVVNQPTNNAVINNSSSTGKNKALNSNQSKTKTRTKKKAPGSVKKFTAKNKKKEAVTLSWKKVSGVKGYQLQYAQNKKFTKKKKSKLTKKRKYTVKKLKKKKTYYFRVRAYKLNGKKKVYGKWSKIKKVKVKK